VLATALKRSQGNIKEMMAKMEQQQQQHMKHIRQNALDKYKMARLMKLQRRVAGYRDGQLQQRLRSLRAGAPLPPPPCL
jgi:hypothetical protein